MKAKFVLPLLPLLSAAMAFPQKVVTEGYNAIVRDTVSRFYHYPAYDYVGSPKTPHGEYAFPFDRITTSSGDTIVCFVRVGAPSSDTRKMVWAKLVAEDERSYNIGKDGKISDEFFIGETEAGGKKLKSHYRIKVRAYKGYFPKSSRPYPREFGEKPFSKRITAYIDYFPFYPWQSRVRYKVRNVRLRTGPKYDVVTPKNQEAIREMTAARDSMLKRQREDFERKRLKWERRYAKKYRPDQLHFYERLDSLKKKTD